MSEQITSQDFQSKVIEADKPVLVDFFATWCGPCKMLAPILEEVAEEVKGSAYVYSVDIDQSIELAQRFNIMSVPTLILFKNGEPVQQTMGAQPKDALMKLFG